MKRFLMMRTIAKHQAVDWRALTDAVEGESHELARVLDDMRKRGEIEIVVDPRTGRMEKFALTSSGMEEYVKAVGSVYEFPE
jgi:DNA-binding MarR family transcriptional regulator